MNNSLSLNIVSVFWNQGFMFFMDGIHYDFLEQQCRIQMTIPPLFFGALQDHASLAGAVGDCILLSPCSCNHLDRGMTKVEMGTLPWHPALFSLKITAMAPETKRSYIHSAEALVIPLMERWSGLKLK